MDDPSSIEHKGETWTLVADAAAAGTLPDAVEPISEFLNPDGTACDVQPEPAKRKKAKVAPAVDE